MSRPPRKRRRLLGLLLAVVFLELSLQVAGPIVQSLLSRSDEALGPDSALTILCVGDSNTYGLNVPRALAWPARLAGQLRPRYDAPIAVVNRGVPGRNSAQVARALSDDLEDVQPDLVMIQVGVNDTWNTAAEQVGMGALWGRLKLVRLARVLAAGVTSSSSPPFEVRTDASGEFVVSRGEHTERVNAGGSSGLVRRGDDLIASLERGWSRALRAIREHGARPVLLTYPEFQDAHGEVNAALRQFASDHQTLLIDLERDFMVHFQTESYAELMFNDHHPNPRGYDLLALDVIEALETAGLLAPTRPTHRAIVSAPDVPPMIQATQGGELHLSGPPRWAFQVAVGRRAQEGQGLALDSGILPLQNDALLGRSRTLPELSGWLDEAGRAHLRVSPVLRDQAQGEELWACLLLLHDPDAKGVPSLVAAISEPSRLSF